MFTPERIEKFIPGFPLDLFQYFAVMRKDSAMHHSGVQFYTLGHVSVSDFTSTKIFYTFFQLQIVACTVLTYFILKLLKRCISRISDITLSQNMFKFIHIGFGIVLSLFFGLFSSTISFDVYTNKGPNELFQTMDELSVLVKHGRLKLVLEEGELVMNRLQR